MKTAAIIAEYNPFHNGHKHQINMVRKKNISHVISCMSGNYVQRGGFAIFDKYERAKMAVKSGIDLVVELPLQFSTSTAGLFSKGAIDILDGLGVVDYLAFGAETDNINLLNKMVLLLNHKELDVKKHLDIGLSFPTAKAKAIKELNNKLRLISEEDILIMEEPNNILGFEYINSLNRLNSKIQPIIIKRHKVSHDSTKVEKNFASASKIRKLIYNNEIFYNYIPEELIKDFKNILANGKYISEKKLNISAMSYLKRLDEKDFLNIFDVSEGLENRIVEKIKTSNTLDELYEKIKTKRYTMSRIRRIIINTFINVEKNNLFKTLPYVKVLAFNKKGVELLKKAKKTSEFKIITSQKRVEDYDKSQAEIEKRASALYGFLLKNTYNSDWEYTKQIKIIS